MKKIFIIIVIVMLTFTFSGCKKKSNTVEMKVNINEQTKIVTIELYKEHAPITVKNFLSLVDDNFYDGLTFHRVIENFMVQGGRNPNESLNPIVGEFSSNNIKNDLKHC